MTPLTFHILKPTDEDSIEQISDWYFKEWTIPKERTIVRLANHPNNDVVFQIVLGKSNKLIATGGLYNNVGIFQAHPKFKEFSPWVALLYTDAESRNMGFGRELLGKIEEIAKEKGFKKLYLFTFTAESLYIRAGWRELERVEYKGHDTAVMEKTI